jgi:hypothetical protein
MDDAERFRPLGKYMTPRFRHGSMGIVVCSRESVNEADWSSIDARRRAVP